MAKQLTTGTHNDPMPRSRLRSKGIFTALSARFGLRIIAWTLAVLLCLLHPLGNTIRADSSAPTEFEIKAALLYNFAKLIEWPEQAFRDSEEPLSIGILGNDPFGDALERVVKDKTIGDRKISIRRTSGHTSCQLLFISQSESDNTSRVLETVDGLPVVTVSELEGFTELGGTIEFFIEDNTVRFAINVEAADRAGVKMAPELLRVATVTEDEADEEDSQERAE